MKRIVFILFILSFFKANSQFGQQGLLNNGGSFAIPAESADTSLYAQAVSTNTLVSAYANEFYSELLKSGVTDSVKTSGAIKGKGIKVGIIDTAYFKTDNPTDAFRIIGTDTSLAIIATTASGVSNGIYYYLRTLGYRYYMPNPLWHIAPTLVSAYRVMDYTGKPSYLWRRIQTAHGYPNNNVLNEFERYLRFNLQNGSNIVTKHSYQAIVNRWKTEFKAHPEWFGDTTHWRYLMNTNTAYEMTKFNIDDTALVSLLIRDALNTTTVNTYSISMTPSDGGGWKTGVQKGNGTASDQAFWLANKIASVFDTARPNTRIGMLAYNDYATPPSFAVNPRVAVQITEGFSYNQYSLGDIYNLWAAAGVDVGSYLYAGVHLWDYDMPGQVGGSHPSFSNSIVSRYNVNNARWLAGETEAGWISRGLGHYLIARVAWNKNENIDTIETEFYTKCFGPAAPYMQAMFQEWDLYRQKYPLDGNLVDWYNLCLKGDSAAAGNTAILERIKQIKVYLHFTLLYRNYLTKGKTYSDRTTVLNYVHRYLETGIMPAYTVEQYEGQIDVNPKDGITDPEYNWKTANAIWKTPNFQYSSAQIDSIVAADKSVLDPIVKAKPTVFPTSFQPATTDTGTVSDYFRGIGNVGPHYVIFNITDAAGAYIGLRNLGIASKKAMNWSIYNYRGEISTAADRLVKAGTTPYIAGVTNYVTLTDLAPGAYLLLINDYKEEFDVFFKGAVSFGIVGSNEYNIYAYTLTKTQYFYHNDSDTINAYVTAISTNTRLISPTGRSIYMSTPGFYVVPVLPEEKNKIWSWTLFTKQNWIQFTNPFFCPDSRFVLKPLPNY